MFVTKNLYQNDEAWKNTPLGQSSQTIGSWGCLLTSVTMMLNGIGYNETPVTVNDKMKKAGGFQGPLFIPSVLPYVWPNCAYRDMQPCESFPAPIQQIDAAVAAGKPVILQVDWNKQAGIQTHFVLIKQKKGDDYVLYDPYKYGGDGPDKEVLLTTRYKFNGATLATEISAVLWFENYSIAQPEPPKVEKVPVPADAIKIYTTIDDLALRADPSTTGYLWKRMLKVTELTVLDPTAEARAKFGVNGQWVKVQDPDGAQGFVAAWYVTEDKKAASAPPAAAPAPAAGSAPKPTAAPAAPLPPGAIGLFPTEELSFRSQPTIAPETLIRRVPVTEQLVSLESADQTKAKVGVVNQWLKVRDASKKEGFVAAWYVKYASGSAPASAPAAASSVPAGAMALVPTEELSFRSQPTIAPETLIRRMPVTEQLISLESAEQTIAKVGVNNQWLKVQDSTKKEGYVAAWYVKYAGGSTAQAAAPAAPAASGGEIKARTTVEGVSLRRQTYISDSTLIKRVPLNHEFTIAEAGGETKIGANNQWIKVKDATHEGFVAAWFLTR
jgi:uncharacterized protein YgiM (DUF1202 family)